MPEDIHKRVARKMLDRFMPQTNASPVWIADEVKSIAEILRREYPQYEKGSVYDIARGALHSLEVSDEENYALKIKLAKARDALKWYASPLSYDESGVPIVQVGLAKGASPEAEHTAPWEPDFGARAAKAIKEIGDATQAEDSGEEDSDG